MCMCVFGRTVVFSLIITQTFQRALTSPADSCTEIKSGVTISGRVCRKAMLGVCDMPHVLIV